MTEVKRGRGRPRRAELSERQREVLDLLVAGKTNAEIGEALGISLDGAKYHVREICGRVGVDTREEAAEWWRQERGLRARFALPEWQRVPRPVRWATFGGAGLAACAAVVVMLLLVFAEDGNEAGLESGTWLAIVVPTANDTSDSTLTRIHVAKFGTSEEFVLTEPGHWGHLSWSPDGRYLFAIRADTAVRTGTEIYLFDVARQTSSTTAWEVPWMSRTELVWSPDLTRVALGNTGADHAWSGTLDMQAVLRGPEIQEQGQPTANTCTPEAWKPDSSQYICIHDGGARVIDRDGTVLSEIQEDGLWPAEVLPFATSARVQRLLWEDAGTLTGLIAWSPEGPDSATREYARFEGTIAGDASAIHWDAATPASRDEIPNLILEREPLQREMEETGRATTSPQQQSRDGRTIGAVLVPAGSGARVESGAEFVAFVDGRRFTYPVGIADAAVGFFAGGYAWDVVRID